MLRLIILAMLIVTLPAAGGADERVDKYFPVNAWKPLGTRTQQEQSQFFERWFGGQLAAMREPSLAFGDYLERGPNELRLLFLPTFSRSSMLRITYSDQLEVSFEFKKLSGTGSSFPGELVEYSTGAVDEDDADRVFTLLEVIAPWKEAEIPVARGFCYDGTQTVIEFRKGDAYRVIERHECDLANDDSIRRLIHVFDEISGGQMIAPGNFEPRD